MSYSNDDYDEKYEEEEILYVDEGLPRDEIDEFYVSSYDEFMRPRYIHDGFSYRGRPKESVMYLANYWGLSDGLMKDLSF